MGIFTNPKNIVYDSKAMRGDKSLRGMQSNKAMKDLLSNKKVAKVLDKKSEQMEFYKALKEKEGGGGVTKNEIRQVLGKLRSGKGKNIDKNETMGLADELIGKGIFAKRYLYERDQKPRGASAQKIGNKTPANMNSYLAANMGKPMSRGNMREPITNIKPIANLGAVADTKKPAVDPIESINNQKNMPKKPEKPITEQEPEIDPMPVESSIHQPIDDLLEGESNLGVMPDVEKEPENKSVVLGLIGEKGGGKGSVAGYIMGKFASSHYEVSKILSKVLENLHIEQSRENYGTLAVVLKEGFGSPVLINAMLLEMEKDDSKIIIADGIRMYGDVDPFRKKYGKKFYLVYVTADVRTRYERTKNRGEKAGEANATFDQFMAEENGPTEKAIREIGKGADFRLTNNGSPEELNEQIEAMMDKILGKKKDLV